MTLLPRSLFVCCVLASIGCSSQSSSDAPPASRPPSSPPVVAEDAGTSDAAPPPSTGDAPLEWKSCALDPNNTALGSAECATTTAPLDYAKPDGTRIDLGVKRLVQSSTPKAQLWLVDGGPGGSAVTSLASLARQIRTLRPDVELYAVDHRGVGGSHPLDCPNQEAPSSPGGRGITDDEWPLCIDHLKSAHAAFLPHITTSNAMRDLARLVDRVKKPNVPVYVYGGSYGTYAVLRYLALFPKQPSAVILEGIQPTGRNFDPYDREMDAATHALFDRCASDPSCSAHLGPDPWKTAGDVVASFGAGHCPTLGIDADGARAFLGANSLFWQTRDLLPAIVHRLRRCEPRDVTAVVHFYQTVFGGQSIAASIGARPPPLALNDGQRDTQALFFHVALSEMWHWDGKPSVDSVLASWRSTTISTGLTVRLARLQDAWPVYARGPEVTADLPAYDGPLLMVQGGLDPATAVGPSRRLRDRYKGAHQTWVEVPTGAHMVMEGSPMAGNDDCGRRVVLGFLDDPSAPVDTTCTSNVAPIAYDGYPQLNQLLLGVSDAWDG